MLEAGLWSGDLDATESAEWVEGEEFEAVLDTYFEHHWGLVPFTESVVTYGEGGEIPRIADFAFSQIKWKERQPLLFEEEVLYDMLTEAGVRDVSPFGLMCLVETYWCFVSSSTSIKLEPILAALRSADPC